MLGRRLFGNKKGSIEEPKRPATPPQGQIFSEELFQGKRGDILRELGYAPDNPRNQAANGQPLSVLLAEDEGQLRRSTQALNAAAKFSIVPVHLLPAILWHMGAGPWLRQDLDLSPHRPWNVIFLPRDEEGAAALGLPVAPSSDDDQEHIDQTRAMMSCVHDAYCGRTSPEVEAALMLLSHVRSNFPKIFPPDRADFSDRVRVARAHVRALAFLHAGPGGKIDKEAHLKSHATFLSEPEVQLIA